MRNSRRTLWLIASLLSGCNAHQGSLESFIVMTEAKAEQQHVSERLLKPAELVEFKSLHSRSPFDLPKTALVQTPDRNKSCWQPRARTKQGLELFRLDELQVKGVMSKGGKMSGLVMLPNRRVVQVEVGQYLGENNGKIAKITDSGLIIGETLSDGLGCWYQRQIKLAMK